MKNSCLKITLSLKFFQPLYNEASCKGSSLDEQKAHNDYLCSNIFSRRWDAMPRFI